MLSFKDIHHSYDKTPALSGINLEVENGEIICLLGQSGCGKSTLMNLVAGLLPLQHGEITLNSETLSSTKYHMAAEKRPVGLVFQDGALFPHLSIAKNITFGVKDKSLHAEVTSRLLSQIGLSGYEGRYPHTLSGGQRQRVALARALARQPEVLLMDEPFASIDVLLRRSIRQDIYHLLKARGGITIVITHDPEEAIELADKIAVMEGGKITQFGTAQELYNSPQSLFVSLMSGEGAVLSGRVNEGGVSTEFGRFAFEDLELIGHPKDNSLVDILLRHNCVSLLPVTTKGGVVVQGIRDKGNGKIVTVESQGGVRLLLHVQGGQPLSLNQSVELKRQENKLPAFIQTPL